MKLLDTLQKMADDLQPRRVWPNYLGGVLNRAQFISASESGSCLRKTWFEKNAGEDGTAPRSANGFAERGNAIEAWLVDRLKPLADKGEVLVRYMGDDQRSFFDMATGLSGTPDGLLYIPEASPLTGSDKPGKYVLLEIKSISTRASKANLPRKKHVMQTQLNMHLVSKCLNIDVLEAVILYVDSDDLFNQVECPVDRHDDYWTHAVERAEQIRAAKGPNDLLPEGVSNGDCDYCAFTDQCNAAINVNKTLAKAGGAGPFASLAGDEPLSAEDTATMSDFLAADATAKTLTKNADTLKADVKAILLKRGGPVHVDGCEVSLRLEEGRLTVDKKLMEDDGLDVTAYSKRGAPFTVIAVKGRD